MGGVVEAGLRIEGYASLWGVADLNGDVVARGAFADSLARTGAAGVRMLHQHEARAVVGVWDEMVEDDRGLFVRGRIFDWSAEARFAGALSRAGALDGLSIGFRAAKARRDGRLRVWRVERVEWDETPRAVLAPVIDVAVGDLATDWRPGERPRTVGRPVFRVLDLPPLPGFEDDDRPWVAVAADPWVPMDVLAGPEAEALTVRATVETPATIGVLVEALGPGVIGRWDDVNTLRVRIEGRAPMGVSEAAVLAGANAVAVETAAGWEIVQFRSASLVVSDAGG